MIDARERLKGSGGQFCQSPGNFVLKLQISLDMPSALDAFHAPASRNPCKERCREHGFNEAMGTVKHTEVAGLLVPLGWTHLGTPVADQPGPSDGVIRGIEHSCSSPGNHPFLSQTP